MLRYAKTPVDLPQHCDGCGARFTIDHALNCKKGGLVIGRHEEVKEELIDLASRAFRPSQVRDEPRIHNVAAQPQSGATPEAAPVTRLHRQNQDRGDVMIRGLWEKGTYCILDVRVTHLDAKTHRKKTAEKVSLRSRARKETKICGCLPRTVPTFLTFCRIL